MEQQIINVNEYNLVGTAGDYVTAISALAQRTEAEGHPGVLSYRFYVNAAEGTAGATIVYEDADAWLGHHELAYQWPEMAALQATISLGRLTVFGPLNDAVERWLSRANLTSTHYDRLAAGFGRT